MNRDLLCRFKKVVPLNTASGEWNRQEEYRGEFLNKKFVLTDDMLWEMLTHQYWLATRAPQDGYTDRISLDIDCKDVQKIGSRNDRYRRIRHLFGVERMPLVYGTPSGHGIRVVFRIPRAKLREVTTRPGSGLVADVLRAAGLDPKKGAIEIFPQVRQAERLMLGRRMPLLDPETLNPLAHAAIGDTFDEDLLAQALEEVEAWHARECTDLLDYLRHLPRVSVAPVGSGGDGGSEDSILVLNPVRGIEPSPATRRLIEVGLPGRSTRSESEWAVGLAMAANPAAYPQYGLNTHSSPRDFAHALACWLAEHHNGHSRDWTVRCRRSGSTEAAIAWWTDRYLRPAAGTGDHMIRRLIRTVNSLSPSSRRVRQLNMEERIEMLEVAERHAAPGIERYKLEVWLFAWLRAVKDIVSHHDRQLTPLPICAGADGQPTIVVEIKAEWMKLWPYGNGAKKDVRGTSYVRYREILREEGLMQWAAPYINPRRDYSDATEWVPGHATRFRVPYPDMATPLRDVPIAPWDLNPLLSGIPGAKDVLTLDEAYHSLHVASTGIDCAERYGRRTSERILRYVTQIQRARQGLITPTTSSGDAENATGSAICLGSQINRVDPVIPQNPERNPFARDHLGGTGRVQGGVLLDPLRPFENAAA